MEHYFTITRNFHSSNIYEIVISFEGGRIAVQRFEDLVTNLYALSQTNPILFRRSCGVAYLPIEEESEVKRVVRNIKTKVLRLN
jgi:sulfatase maturation enzyme AslB (radical SAM superfamily)